MAESGMTLPQLAGANATAGLNTMAGFEVVAADGGTAEIAMEWRDDLTQYAGHLHAGMIAALLDTACGFAAATIAGNVTASHFAMNCLRPAVGDRFVAKGTTVQAGRRQIFASAKLFAVNHDGKETLIATGETLMVPFNN